MTACAESGRSMIEMLGVLAIVGVLSVGGIAGFNKGMAKYKSDRLINQVNEIQMNIRNIFLTQHNYEALSNQNAISLGLIPTDMYDHEVAASIAEITHAWGGKVRIFPSKSAGGTKTAFELIITDINASTCQNFVTQDWGADPSSGFIAMLVRPYVEEIETPVLDDIVTPADADPTNGIFTVGTHNASLPMTIELAYSTCKCDPVGCDIALKYQ